MLHHAEILYVHLHDKSERKDVMHRAFGCVDRFGYYLQDTQLALPFALVWPELLL